APLVTGVQTCALPIFPAKTVEVERARRADASRRARDHDRPGGRWAQRASDSRFAAIPPTTAATAVIAKATTVGPGPGAIGARAEIGRASCRERGGSGG